MKKLVITLAICFLAATAFANTTIKMTADNKGIPNYKGKIYVFIAESTSETETTMPKDAKIVDSNGIDELQTSMYTTDSPWEHPSVWVMEPNAQGYQFFKCSPMFYTGGRVSAHINGCKSVSFR